MMKTKSKLNYELVLTIVFVAVYVVLHWSKFMTGFLDGLKDFN